MNDLDLFPSSLLRNPLKIKSPLSVQLGLDQDLKDAQSSILLLQSSIKEAEKRLGKAEHLFQTMGHLLALTQQTKENEVKLYEQKSQCVSIDLFKLESLFEPVQMAEEEYQKALVLHDSSKVEMILIQQEIDEWKHSLKVQHLLMDNTKLLSKMLQTKVLISSSFS